MVNEIKEKQNSFSFRYGKTGTEVKLYFETALDLKEQIKDFEMNAAEFKLQIDNIKKVMNDDQ